MKNLIGEINKKVAHIIWSLFGTGIVLILLAILVVWTDFMVRLVFGLVILIIAFMFIYSGYKAWRIKKSLEKYFKI